MQLFGITLVFLSLSIADNHAKTPIEYRGPDDNRYPRYVIVVRPDKTNHRFFAGADYWEVHPNSEFGVDIVNPQADKPKKIYPRRQKERTPEIHSRELWWWKTAMEAWKIENQERLRKEQEQKQKKEDG